MLSFRLSLIIIGLSLGSFIWAGSERYFESPQNQAELKSLIERALVGGPVASFDISVSFKTIRESQVRKYFKQTAQSFLDDEWKELYQDGVEQYHGFKDAAEHDPGFAFDSNWNRSARDVFQQRVIDSSNGESAAKNELKAIIEENVYDAHHVGYADHNSDLITGDFFLFGFWESDELGEKGKRVILKVIVKTSES